jgi:hypothetical protein
MAAFDYLSKKDRIALAHHVRSLGTFPRQDTPEGLAELGKEFAAGGERVPPRIPVSLAIQKLAGEEEAPPPLPLPGGDAVAERLVREAVLDPARAARTLRASSAWREEPARLASGAPGNGFAPSVAGLAAEEWKALGEGLQRLCPPPGASPQGPPAGGSP